MEKELLSDKIKMATSRMSFFIEEQEEREELYIKAEKLLIPTQKNLSQKIIRFITLLDKAVKKHSFSPEIKENVAKEIRNLFEMLLPMHEFTDELVKLYNTYHKSTYDDFVEQIEKEMIDSVNNSFKQEGIRLLNTEELPLLEGASLKDLRDFERILAQNVFERSIDDKTPQISDRLYKLTEEQRPMIFDQEYSMIAKDLIGALRNLEGSQETIDSIRELLDDKLTFDQYTIDTTKIQLQIIRLLRIAVKQIKNLNQEDTISVLACVQAFETSMDHESTTRAAFSKFDTIDEFIVNEGREEETGKYKTKFDLFNETVDLVKANSQGLDMALKRIKSREDMIVFFSNHDEEEIN